MPIDFEALLARKRPATAECVIALDAEAVDAVAAARAVWQAAEAAAIDHPELRSAQQARDNAEAALDAAEKAAADATATFRFEGISGPKWDLLVDAHPPTDEQVEKARAAKEELPTWNDDTFPPVAVAACCVEPAMSLEQVQQLFASGQWNAAETQGLFSAAHTASRTRRVPQLGKGFGRTLS